jgi:Sortase domain
MLKRRFWFKLAGLYVALAVFIAAPSLIHTELAIHQSNDIAQKIDTKIAPKPVEYQVTQLGAFASLTFPRLNYTLPIKQGQYSVALASWTVQDGSVQWITEATQLINNQPTVHTILYGHNFADVLGVTNQLVVGDTMTIQTTAGVTLIYRFTGGVLVSPNNTSILQNHNANTLSMFTCAGLFDQYRRLMSFNYVGVEK